MDWCPIHRQLVNGRCIYCCGHPHVPGPVIQRANVLIEVRLLSPFLEVSFDGSHT